MGELGHAVYCSITASHSIVFDLLNRFRPEHPGVELRIQTGDPQHAIDRVLALQEELTASTEPALTDPRPRTLMRGAGSR